MKYLKAMSAAAVASAVAVSSMEHRSLRYSKAGKTGKSSKRSGGSYSYSYSFSLNNMDATAVDGLNAPLQEQQEIQPTFPHQVIGITSKETLDDPSSPQARALHWIMNDDGMTLDIDSPEWTQRYIMASFYFATGGGDWDECNAPKDNSQSAIDEANENCTLSATQYNIGKKRVYGTKPWLSPVPVCEWASTACHDTSNSKKGTISQIEFEDNGLEGILIDELSHLYNLQFLLLEKGKLSGNIPSQLGQLPLIILDLDYNQLGGDIPDEIYDATTLQQIDLNNNQLGGIISPKIKQLSTLTFFQVDNNMMEGTIPEEMGDMKKLGECSHQLIEYALCHSNLYHIHMLTLLLSHINLHSRIYSIKQQLHR